MAHALAPNVHVILMRTWRLTARQFINAARATSDLDMKRKLATRALDLALRAEELERGHLDKSELWK